VGYYNKLDAERQDEIDQIVKWYNFNKDLPDYLMNHILADKKLLDTVLRLWDADGRKNYNLPPVPPRKVRGRRATYRKPKFELTTVMAISIIVSVWALALIGAYVMAGA
jgi:hypothetical protein